MIISLGLPIHANTTPPPPSVRFVNCGVNECGPRPGLGRCLGDPKDEVTEGYQPEVKLDVCTPIRRTISFQACVLEHCPYGEIEVLTVYGAYNCTGRFYQRRGILGPDEPCLDLKQFARSAKLTCEREEQEEQEEQKGREERRERQRCSTLFFARNGANI